MKAWLSQSSGLEVVVVMTSSVDSIMHGLLQQKVRFKSIVFLRLSVRSALVGCVVSLHVQIYFSRSSKKKIVLSFLFPLAGSGIGVLELVVFSLVQFAVQCPSKRDQIRDAFEVHLSQPSLPALDIDLVTRALHQLDRVRAIHDQAKGKLSVSKVSKFLFIFFGWQFFSAVFLFFIFKKSCASFPPSVH
jgi:hypothetical protein